MVISDAEAEDSCSEEEYQSRVEWRFDSFCSWSQSSNKDCKCYSSCDIELNQIVNLLLSWYTCYVKGTVVALFIPWYNRRNLQHVQYQHVMIFKSYC